MLLIADSGSTKVRWEVVQNDSAASTIYTTGINPFYKTTSQIVADLRKELLPKLTGQPEQLFFYGAGISQPDKIEIVRAALREIFPATHATVEHDLLAAARATCGNSPGIACILGTGSNSCLYDGKEITDNVPSLGFMLGDEGSGGYFGRKILQAYYYRELPAELKQSLEENYEMKKETVLNAIYASPTPNKLTASYAKFIALNSRHPFIVSLLDIGFNEFLSRHVCKYENFSALPVHFIGSIAFYNREILLQAMDRLNLKIGVILKSPMEGLVKYHLSA